MIFACIRAAIVAPLLLLLLAATAPLVAQPTFNSGNSHVIIWNTSGNLASVEINASGLIFTDSLKLTHRFAHFDVNQSIGNNQAWGYENPGLYNGQTAGDITAVKDTIGCGLYSISIQGTPFYLNLTDAKWGAVTSNYLYRILIKYDGAIKIYVSAQGSATSWSTGYVTVSSGSTYTYWGLVQALQSGSYLRERTTYNSKRFHVIGADNQLPLESTFVTDATLDVNLDVHVDIHVPDASSLLVQGFDEGLTGSSGTTLLFDDQTGLTVYGSLASITTQYRNEYALFLPSSGSPAPGDWDGIWCPSPTAVNLNHTYIAYAVTGLDIDDCWYDVLANDLTVRYCSGEGVRMTASNSEIHHLNADNNYENNLEIRNGEHFVYDSHFDDSETQNGVVIGDGIGALFRNCRMADNRMNGIYVYTNALVDIDSSQVYGNGFVDGEDWIGIETFYNDSPVSIRYNRVHDQSIGVCAVWGSIFGYYRNAIPVTWNNADSLGRNCIYQNDYNLYGYQGRYELGRTYYYNRVPHYQGGQNSIFDPNNNIQGSFEENSTAYLQDDFWNGNTIFNVSNSTVSTTDALLADSANCGMEGFAAGGLASIAATWNPQAAALHQSWEALTADSLRRLLTAQLSTLSALDAASGFRLAWQMSDSAAARSFLAQVVASSSRPEVLLPAYRYLGEARIDDADWSGAVQAFLAMTQQCAYGGQGYVSAQTMAALAMHLGGNTTAALASLDTLLQVFPDNRDLVTVYRLIGGSGTTPKRGLHRDTGMDPDGFALQAAWPNPTAGTTSFAFTLPSTANVYAAVYDVMGREVRRLAAGDYPSGTTHLTFNGADLPAGIYLLRVSANGETRTQTVRILR